MTPEVLEEDLTAVRGAVAAALGLAVEEVRPGSRLVADLGAQSLDFVELGYRLEGDLGVKIGFDDLFDQDLLQQLMVEGDRELSPAELEDAAARFPFLALPRGARMTMAEFVDLYTVDALARLVAARRGAGGG